MIEGGHMVIARSLRQALREAGHQAEILVTPQNRFGRQASAYLATWLTDVGMSDGQPIDQVISLRYPSYAVRHPRHVCWLNHTMREYYDLWGRFTAGLGSAGRIKENAPPARHARRRSVSADAQRHAAVRAVPDGSETPGDLARLRSTVLYPPPPQRDYRCDGYGDYVFLVSRLTALKRVDLLIEALATADGQGIRAVIAGDGEDREALEALAKSRGLADRVTFAGSLSESELLGHLARCRAVCFPPLDEDYGFVTVEAFASRKAVITCGDSGGPSELVTDGVQGLVCDPTPGSLAVALRRVMDDRALAERMGASAVEFVRQLTWSDTVGQLTGID